MASSPVNKMQALKCSGVTVRGRDRPCGPWPDPQAWRELVVRGEDAGVEDSDAHPRRDAADGHRGCREQRGHDAEHIDQGTGQHGLSSSKAQEENARSVQLVNTSARCGEPLNE
jgi:hypothetical protein